jgi:2-keto-4-pentenoate hydratase/2-oxohepta-3-ene-1,7-dioic acid hydratase in catechol pathway
MKLVTFEVATPIGRKRRLGAMTQKGIVDLNFACAYQLRKAVQAQPYRLANAFVPADMLAFLQGEKNSMLRAQEALAALKDDLESGKISTGEEGERLFYKTDEVKLKAPLPNPTSFRDFYAFEEHVKKGFDLRGEAMPPEWYEMPVYYKGNHQSILGPDDEVVWPFFTEKFDYELELACVIGKKGKNIPEERAAGHIAGFTVLDDFSARDIQKKEMKVRLGPAKGKDFASAIGPVLATPDEVGNPRQLKMTARINGEVWSQGNSEKMHYTFEQMIAFASKDETLFPGDLFGSGTVGGGCGLELGRWVKPGDVIELEIEKIGILRNRVVKK